MSSTDTGEFEARLERHRGIVFKIARMYSSGGAEREDLVQKICLQLWRSYPTYDPARRFSTWMYRVALNTAISFARIAWARSRRDISLDASRISDTAEAPRPREPDERIDRLYRFLHGLSPIDRALVGLYLEDCSYREIGEVLGISETNVGTKISRLKQMMRRDLAPDQENRDGAR